MSRQHLYYQRKVVRYSDPVYPMLYSEGSVVNRFCGDGVGIHGAGSAMNGSFQGFMLNCIIVGLQYDLGKEFDSLGKVLGLERESEFGDLSFDLD